MQLGGIYTLVLALALPAAGAGLSGRISDETGSSIPDARVVVAHQGTGTTLESWTDRNGNYAFEEVRSGAWTLTVSKEGFDSRVQQIQFTESIS